ncbi:hypothetical protein [Streptomyces fractus]|uniref:hypothetical protein n=1 Tax=Streptomyces fractus TaxID=641806 RepID=UPI003CECF1C0
MADEHDKWLNRDAADRLLRGEAPAVSGDAALRADRLTAALYALTEVPAGPEGELPGEDAALKAFRETRAVAAVNGAVDGAANGAVNGTEGGAANGAESGGVSRAASGSARAGRVRRSAGSARSARPVSNAPGRRSLWGRPVRLGAVAAFAACMVGGVAVAAGTGVLPSPFRESDDPAPAASVSAAASPDRPLASSSAGVTEDGHAVPGPTKPSGASGSGSASGSPSRGHGEAGPGDGRTSKGRGQGQDQGQGPGSNASGNQMAKGQARKLVDTCRKYRAGELGAGDVRRLESSAKALGQDTRSLGRFCDRVLARAGTSGAAAGETTSQHTDNKSDSGSTSASDNGNGNGSGGKGGGENEGDNEDEDGDPGATASPSASTGPSPDAASGPSPSPSAGSTAGAGATP